MLVYATSYGSSKVRYWLVTFGDVEVGEPGISRRLGAEAIYESLTKRGLWYLRRPAAKINPNDIIAFYRNGHGFRGSAAVVASTPVTDSDVQVLRECSLPNSFKWKLLLQSVVTFEEPVALAPLLAKMSFVRNKVHWGLDLRSSPRQIPVEDFLTVSKVGCKPT